MSHDHDHSIARKPDDLGRAFLVGIALNLAFVVIEAVFGVVAHSTALLADAAHNLSDVLGLAMAWGAATLARRAPSNHHTYGFRRSTVLAALANAVLLLAAVGAVTWESIGRLRVPGEPHSGTMMSVAAVGVVVNGASALLFLRGRKGDANVRGAFLHLAADAAVSAGVVVAGALLWKTGWRWLDPATSLVISAVVLLGTWGLLRDALHLAMDGVPKSVEIEQVRGYLLALPDVEAVHDLHIWAMSTTEIALTAHLVMPWTECPPSFLGGLEHELGERFGIAHVTVQIEAVGNAACARGQVGAV
jgi:cobalt-zinc-cadmium efflux system protein